MKVGDYVNHINIPGEPLRIKRMCATVATVERINEPKYLSRRPGSNEMVHPVYICLITNLIKL